MLLLFGSINEGLSYHGLRIHDECKSVDLVDDTFDGGLYRSRMLETAVRLDWSVAKCAPMISANFCRLCTPSNWNMVRTLLRSAWYASIRFSAFASFDLVSSKSLL